MASSLCFNSGTRFLIAATTILCFVELLQCVYCSEFEVGERTGWIVPHANDTDIYNKWASQKRFKVGDTIRFRYKKDSVMEVEKKDYNECNSKRPNFFSNTGDTVFTLDRAGFFYFISGAAGHCDKGEKMIVWVIGQDVKDEHAKSGASINAVIVSYGFVAIIVASHVLSSI